MEFDPETIRQFEHRGWERAASAYGDTFAHASGCYVEALLDAGRVGAGVRVLDLACGTGLATAAAARRGAEATGRDFSAAMLEAARAANPGLHFDHGDAEVLPYPQASFDAVVSNFGMHHFPHPDRAAAAAAAVLRPGGVFAFTSWAEPAHNIAWRLLFDAVRAHGDPDAAKAPPSGGGLARAEAALAVLHGAGFEDCEAGLETREWHVDDPGELVAALRRGTVRTAALIEAQDQSAIPAILAHIARAAAPFRRGDGFAIPIVAIVARGTRA
jgi:SAM-dependent methyltransferase